MHKSRRKELEEEALRENLTPTKELEVDESGLSNEEKGHYSFPWAFVIIGGSILIIMAIVIVLIYVFGGPKDNTSESVISETAGLINKLLC